MNPGYKYKAIITDVYDGDTVTCDISLGFGVNLEGTKLRLFGLNTPEIRTKDPEEKKKGLKARDELREKILFKEVILETKKDKRGKFGRILAIIHVKQTPESEYININDWLIDQDLAVVAKY